MRCEIERSDLMQRAIGLAAAARGAHVVVDECIGHWTSSWWEHYRLRAISTFMISLVPAQMRMTRASRYMCEMGYSSM